MYIYIYIYIYICMHIYIMSFRCVDLAEPPSSLAGRAGAWRGGRSVQSRWATSERPEKQKISKAPKGNGIGATGSKNPLAY